MKSRLAKIALFYHGSIYPWDPGFTASFRPLVVEFSNTKLARSLPSGWYILSETPRRTRVIIREPDDIIPVSAADFAEIARRMRIRFTKLLTRAKETKTRSFENTYIISARDVFFVADEARYIVYVAVSKYVRISVEIFSRNAFLDAVRDHVDDKVVLYIPGDEPWIALVAHFF